MNMVRRILLAAGIVTALVLVAVVGTAAIGMTAGLNQGHPSPAASPHPAQSPRPLKPNDDATHDNVETQTHEAAENAALRPGARGCRAQAHW